MNDERDVFIFSYKGNLMASSKIGNGKWGTGNGESLKGGISMGNGESLKGGISKMGNL